MRVSFKKHLHSKGREAFTLDVSFAARDGITILFGPSGSGKTTTLNVIAGILTPDEGRIALDDGRVLFDSAANINLPIRRRKVGYVFQDYALFPHLTAEENVAYGISGPERRQRAREMLALFRISRAYGSYPAELSGGEQQRVALARAMASNPSILLLDEPLSAVDVATRTLLLEEIETAQRESRIPFLYVTHNHAEAARIGKQIVLLSEGRVVQEGRPLEVFNSPQSVAAERKAEADTEGERGGDQAAE